MTSAPVFDFERDVKPLLYTVSTPGQYIGGEINSVAKAPGDVKVRFAFCYPDTYAIGMSNAGLQILYQLINSRGDSACERVFSPWPDFERKLREYNLPLFSLETKTPLFEFDFLGFTLQHEACYTNVLAILELGRIPILAADRVDGDPIVVGGGPAATYPEPMADFFDLFVIGDGEEVVAEILDRYAEAKGRASRSEIILDIAKNTGGVYAPAYYGPTFDSDGVFCGIEALEDGLPAKIEARQVADLSKFPLPDKPVVPFTETVHDRISVEIMRGCPNSCKFCHASSFKGGGTHPQTGRGYRNRGTRSCRYGIQRGFPGLALQR